MKPVLLPADYADAAVILACDIPAIKAVAEVESRGAGFLSDGRLKILFEGHKFFKYTQGKYAANHPTICHSAPTRSFYATGKNDDERGAGEWKRLEEAKALDPRAALLSASWGKFQIMGFNHVACGYGSVEKFVAALDVGEQAHLMAFISFLQHVKLDAPLREHRWADFAKGYNGAGYAENRYDEKMAAAHARYAKAA